MPKEFSILKMSRAFPVFTGCLAPSGRRLNLALIPGAALRLPRAILFWAFSPTQPPSRRNRLPDATAFPTQLPSRCNCGQPSDANAVSPMELPSVRRDCGQPDPIAVSPMRLWSVQCNWLRSGNRIRFGNLPLCAKVILPATGIEIFQCFN